MMKKAALSLVITGSMLTAANRTPVVLELFTSEGCSSCPPADQLLEKLDRDQPIPGADLIVLSEHVDYWNHLGWADPFSSPLFSARQRDYAGRLGSDEVYTPELVVDGSRGMVGSDGRAVKQAIEEAIHSPKQELAITATRDGSKGEVRVTGMTTNSSTDLVLILASDHVQSRVAGGENANRTLNHVAVVYSLRKLKMDAEQVRVDLKPGVVRVIAFVQDHATGKVLAAAQTRV